MMFSLIFCFLFVNLSFENSKEPIDKYYDAVVIGSGISGFAAASKLSEHYWKILVIDQSYRYGGSIQSFDRTAEKTGHKFEFAVGLHYLGNNSVTELDLPLFDQVTDEPIEFFTVGQPMDSIIVGDKQYDGYPYEKWFEVLSKQFPDDVADINTFRAKLEASSPKDPTTLLDAMSDMSNESLKVVLGHYTMGTGSFKMNLGLYFLYLQWAAKGIYYPYGSGEAIVDSIYKKLIKNRVTVAVNCEIKEITTERNSRGQYVVSGVRINGEGCNSDGDDKVIKTGIVVNGESVKKLYTPEIIEVDALPSWLSVITNEMTFAPIIVWFGLTGSPEQLGIEDKVYYYFPTDQYYTQYDEYMNQESAYGEQPIPYYFYTSSTTRNPKSPKGISELSFILPTNYRWWKQWEKTTNDTRPFDYEKQKQHYGDLCKKRMLEHFNVTEEDIELTVIASPLTINHFLNHPKGAIYGIENNLLKRPFAPMESGIVGLYNCGQDTSGAGVQPSLSAALAVSKLIIRDFPNGYYEDSDNEL